MASEWSEREKTVYREIEAWAENLAAAEERGRKRKEKFDTAYEKLPDEMLEKVHGMLDAVLFQISSFADGNLPYGQEIEKMLSAARLFDNSVSCVADMQKLSIDQLDYIAERQQSRYHLLSFVQGGLSGTGKPLLAAGDVLFLLVANLRAVQLTAATYGYEAKTPFELLAALKIIFMAAAPEMVRYAVWKELMDELDGREQDFFTESGKIFHRYLWPGTIGHAGKLALFTLLRPKKRGKINWAGATIGAVSNYYFSKKVGECARKYYQYRFLKDKHEKTSPA
ncbi:hypothetical protein BpJC4_14660 [Weizmannia acidilactici]|uniref:EcsC family protein n=1 Tax=Weizmannia acidilactici TaxID=2607726 RepID=UPI00124C0E85|nr:EcsC family protein [Weizmannia acidilactici]GER66995.1 hypothetical protein BpJC4_14660 [Weizmannia acidilactici]